MPITLNCPKCRKPFRVRDESVGMRVKCPSCGAVLQVPATLSSASVEGKADDSNPAPSPKSGPMTPRSGGAVQESLLTDLPVAGPTAGPPSLPISQARRDEEDEGGRRGAPIPMAPIPTSRRPVAAKNKPAPRTNVNAEAAEQIIEDAGGWSAVRCGLRWIQCGLLFSMIYALYMFGIAIYAFKEHGELPEHLPNQPPGLLDVANMSLFQELEILTQVGSGALLFVFGLIGLLRCLRVPDTARTRGLVSGTILLSFISFAGFAILSWPQLRRLFELPVLPAEAVSLANLYFMYFAVLTLTWFVLFLGQAGAVLRSGKVLTDAAYSAMLVVFLIIGVRIANEYYPLSVTSPKVTDEKMIETFVIQSAITAVINVLIALRLLSLAGIVRSAIRRWREENQDTLAAEAE